MFAMNGAASDTLSGSPQANIFSGGSSPAPSSARARLFEFGQSMAADCGSGAHGDDGVAAAAGAGWGTGSSWTSSVSPTRTSGALGGA